MKNSLKLLITLLFMTCATLAFADSETPIPLEQEEIININTIDHETLNGFFEGQFPTVVLKINHSERIPLNAFVNSEIEAFAKERGAGFFFRTNKDLYLRNIDGEFSYKTHSSDWKDVKEYVSEIKRAILRIHGPEGLKLEIGAIAKKNA